MDRLTEDHLAQNMYIGKSVCRVDASEKVTGEAIYTTDIRLPGMLVGKMKGSQHPFAKILSINTTKARKLTGVRSVITAKEMNLNPFGVAIPDEFALAHGHVRYAGEPVAAVAAVDDEIAEEALDLIEVEYEILDPLLEPEDAMRDGAPAIHPERSEVKNNIGHYFKLVRGEGATAFDRADLILEDDFSTQAQHQAYLEPQSCLAHWANAGKLTIWASNQQPFRLKEQLAQSLGIPDHQVRVIRPYVGGGFGGKLYLRPHYVISSLLSRETGRPVKITHTRVEDFLLGRPRISEYTHIRLGFMKDGTIVAKDVSIVADAGAYMDTCPFIVKVSLTNPEGIYRIKNVVGEARVVYTNKVPRTAFRGYGVPEALFAMESLLDVAAEKLGIDPVEIRLRNCTHKGDITTHGWIINSCGLEDALKTVAKESNWSQKKQHKPDNTGIGVACQVNVSGQRALHAAYDGSGAMITMDQTGKIRVVSGETEIGQGTTTVFAQIAAEELGVSIDDIEVVPFVDTDTMPYSIGTHASRVTTLGGNAVLLAAKDLKKQIIQHASLKLSTPPERLNIRNSVIYDTGSASDVADMRDIAYDMVFRKLGGVPITAIGNYVVPGYVVLPDETRFGNPSVGFAYSAQVAEVRVDKETGQVEVLNVWVGQDLGRVLNPMVCEGQVEGGVVQGMGYALTENVQWEGGHVINPNFRDYKTPDSAGIPKIHTFFIESMEPGGPFGAKSVAEAALNPTCSAIANAIYDAIGVRIKCLPLSPDKILQALREKNK